MLNLAVKYRPLKLNKIYGHKLIAQEFYKRALKNNYPQVIFFTGRTGCGKCITNDSLLLTAQGFCYVDEFSKSKSGFSNLNVKLLSKEKISETSHFFEELANKTYRIKTFLGFEIEGTPEHKIYCFDSVTFKFQYKSLENLQETDYVYISKGTNIFNFNSQELDFTYKKNKKARNEVDIIFPKYLTKDLSRLLGYYIANGSIYKNTLQMSTTNKKIKKDICSIVEKLGQKIKFPKNKDFTMGYKQLTFLVKKLIGNQFSKNFTSRYKKVPEFILKGTKENQIAFINALFDCDSYITNNCCLEYYTASKQLCKEIQLLLLNLNILSYVRESYNEKYKHIYYTLIISSDDLDKYFKLIDNSLKYENFKERYKKKRNTNIKKYPIGNYVKFQLNLWKNEVKYDKGGNFYFEGKYYKSFLPKYKITNRYFYLTQNFIKIYYDCLKKNLQFDVNNILKDLVEFLEFFVFSNFCLDKIENKQYFSDKKIVYDFVVPEVHNFYGNGFINHNTTLTRIIAKNILCQSLDRRKQSCNVCEVCKVIDREKLSDFYYEFNASNLDLDKMKMIGQLAEVTHLIAIPKKVIVIDEMQELFNNKKAQKNILKLLERPNKNVFFILGSMDDSKVDQSIKDRSVMYKLQSIEIEDVGRCLESICVKEGIDINEDDRIKVIIELAVNSKGSMRNAISLLDRVIEGNLWSLEKIEKELSIYTREKVNYIINAIISGDFSDINIFDFAESFLDEIEYKFVTMFLKLNNYQLSEKQEQSIRGIKINKLGINSVQKVISELAELHKFPYVTKTQIAFNIIKISNILRGM